MTLETSARVARLDRGRARPPEARDARHHVLRRRTAPEPAGDVRHGRAHVARDAGARREADHEHHHERPAADAGNRRSAAPVRAAGRQDHAGRGQAHARPDASAPRRPGHVRPHRREHPQASSGARGSPSAATSTRARPTASRACSTSSRRRTSPTSSSRSASSRWSGSEPAPSRRACSPLTPVDAERQAARRLVHDGRRGAAAVRPATAAPSWTRRWSCSGRRPSATGSRPPTACTWAPATCTTTTPTRSVPTDRSTAARASRVRRGCRPATSTAAPIRGANTNRKRFDTLDPWKACGDCAFIPVCAGGCLTASYAQLGDMNMPTCHKASFESAVNALAHNVASAN